MARDSKEDKISAVTNLRGGPISEINLLSLVVISSCIFWAALQSRQSFFTPYSWLACAVDFVLHCVTFLLATTVYSGHLTLFNCLLLLPPLFLLPTSRKKSVQAKPKAQSKNDARPIPIKPFVTAYRGMMLVMTCIGILAVDFRAFPRRFAKVETWGTSVMDIGVGSFVFSAGLVGARPLLVASTKKTSSQLVKALRSSLPLAALGLARLYSVKSLDYAEHVSEYGVHWNFFFTLATLPPLVAIIDSAFAKVPRFIVALAIGIIYELLLNFTNLRTFILSAPRVDLLSMNREGIVSFWGYLSIFLIGQASGLYTLPRSFREGKPSQRSTLEKLAAWSIFWCAAFFVATSYKYGLALQVSRRLANLSYIVGISAYNTTQLTMMCGIELVFFPSIYDAHDKDKEDKQVRDSTSTLLRAFNRNGLAVFLLANLLTGLVNLTLPTLSMRDEQAVLVLVAYIMCLSSVALALDHFNISIKL